MCGVFGYVGEERSDLSGFLLAGLSKLEYRGYDSAGIAILQNGKAKIIRETGELSNLKRAVNGRKFSGNIGIGHTRWATHGGVTKKNAHPHTDCSGKILVVHNGIIENYERLKEQLLKHGHKFVSDTDTEVFAHLVEDKLSNKVSFHEAVRLSFNKLEGLNVIVALTEGQIVAFRKGSPLIAGNGKNGNFISSDIPALASITDKTVLLDEGEGVVISREGVLRINPKTGKLKKAKSIIIKMKEIKADKGSFAHFLIKEIHEQPEVLMRVANNKKKEISKAATYIRNAWGTYFTACGTAAHAGLAATYMFSEIAGRHVNFAVGSEFPYFEDFLVPRSLLIVASQSGETMDTIEAVRAAKRHKSKILALVNVPSSSLERLADFSIHLKAGPERAVLSTKAYVAKLALFLLFTYTLVGKYKKGVELIKTASKKMARMFKEGIEGDIKKLAKKLVDSRHIYIIGRGINYATALEGALKIKEASYIHAEGFAGGELKHGVIALIEKGTPCIAVVANDRARESVLSNAMELKSRGAYIVGVGPENESVFDFWIKTADIAEATILLQIVYAQLLAYYTALERGVEDPDMPRNLAKSVTVK